MEKWKQVEGYKGKYEVSSIGRVRSFARIDIGMEPRLMTPVMIVGYPNICLRLDGKSKFHRIHRLVADAFIGSTNVNHIVNHKNGVKDDNRVENLEFMTRSESILHSYRTGLNPGKGKRVIKSKSKNKNHVEGNKKAGQKGRTKEAKHS